MSCVNISDTNSMEITTKALAQECLETFKECVILTVHVKMFKTLIDCNVRFGKTGNYFIW